MNLKFANIITRENRTVCSLKHLISAFFPCFRCSLRSDCQDAAKDPLYWISYKSGRCTTITSVIPNQLQRTTARTVISFKLHIKHILLVIIFIVGFND